jgi:DNA modification methylase
MARQGFKSVYFLDKKKDLIKGKSVTISFSEDELDLKENIDSISNEEIRELVGVSFYKDLLAKAENDNRTISQFIKNQLRKNSDKFSKIKTSDVTFEGSKKIPFQRWFSFTEGFSPNFVRSLIDKYCSQAKTIYDPFSGTGTTYFAADSKGLSCYYSEVNPLMVFFSEIKIKILRMPQKDRDLLAQSVREESKRLFETLKTFNEDCRLKNNYNQLFGKSRYYDDKTFSMILKLRSYLDKVAESDKLLADTITLAVLSVLLKVSFLKKVGDVRFKTPEEMKRESKELEVELPLKLNEIAEDVENCEFKLISLPELLLYNSKKLHLLNKHLIDAVITSPPYLNGTNYLRNTKIELWFLRYIQYPEDLRGLRDQIVTSGINDVKAKNGKSQKEFNNFNSPILENTLSALREQTYDKRIPIMVDSYFHEMYSVLDGLRRHLTQKATVLIDIGDSIFADVHIPTNDILTEIMKELGFELFEKTILRKRRSRNQNVLVQELLAFRYYSNNNQTVLEFSKKKDFKWEDKWRNFKISIPHQQLPFSKKNWGHPNHSICSYGGKLKPAIANFLVNIFVPENGTLFDPFAGVGTIPFEGALTGRKSFGMDISLPAFFISSSKISRYNQMSSYEYLDKLTKFIGCNKISDIKLNELSKFGFNKTIADYFEPNTLKEIISAREFIEINPPIKTCEMLVVSSLLHVLHGNRPYALSRRSHPITPYAPTGEFEYKNLYEKVKIKLDKTLLEPLPDNFVEGRMFLHDCTDVWPQEIDGLDAIITSPPFFDSTRFYLANWMRLWLCGWNKNDFNFKPTLYVEEKQKVTFSVYKNIIRQARERMKSNGVLVFHLGKSVKCDMAERILEESKMYFSKYDLFDESVIHCQKHGIRDKGTVTSHQYLVLY